eukprot:TRINITY_DN1788_c0_g1_i1.p1 TRINITY_DN1788_c0_g1~~TRINITY_DN1788_c0_g1_i1.p1  ORF type:complete len:188 (+),score=58.94 TRINITY_DN1788_c0_g1_i1:66-566(+)
MHWALYLLFCALALIGYRLMRKSSKDNGYKVVSQIESEEAKRYPSYTLTELAQYDGTREEKNNRIWVAVKNRVFDVSNAREMYGPSGVKHEYAGKDASCALAKKSTTAEFLNRPFSELNTEEKNLLDLAFNIFNERYECVGILAPYTTSSSMVSSSTSSSSSLTSS